MGRIHALFAVLAFFSGSQPLWAAGTGRVLVGVIDLDQMAAKRSPFYRFIYEREERGAIRTLKRLGAPVYDSIRILSDQDATLERFIHELKNLEDDSSVTAIDVVIYLHGHSAKEFPTPEICFVSDSGHCLPVAELSGHLSGMTKLRMLYSDACYGHEHLQAWLASGFKVAAGSALVDSNFYSDLKRFFRRWVQGESFQDAIDYANRGRWGNALDQLLGGDSTKEVAGIGTLTIER